MNPLQKYLDANQVTRYQIYKATGLAQTTLANAVKPEKSLAGLTVKVIKAVADTLGKTPGQVLDDLLALDANS